jgi:hypothetical protein
VAEVSQAVRHELAEAWRTVSADEARLVEDERSEVTEWPAPFLNRFRIYRVEHFAAHGPVLLYAGFAAGERLFVLDCDPDSFVALARADGVRIRSVEMALGYVEALFETTRDMSELTYVVRSFEDIQFRSGSTAKSIPIEPPRAEVAQNGITVTMCVMRRQKLERRRYTVAEGGSVTLEVELVQRDLPAVYGV